MLIIESNSQLVIFTYFSRFIIRIRSYCDNIRPELINWNVKLKIINVNNLLYLILIKNECKHYYVLTEAKPCVLLPRQINGTEKRPTGCFPNDIQGLLIYLVLFGT